MPDNGPRPRHNRVLWAAVKPLGPKSTKTTSPPPSGTDFRGWTPPRHAGAWEKLQEETLTRPQGPEAPVLFPTRREGRQLAPTSAGWAWASAAYQIPATPP